MAEYIIQENTLQNIADAIREVENENSEELITVSEFSNRIKNLTGAAIKVVSSEDELVSIIPNNNELYIIKYENLPYKDVDGNIVNSDKALYVMKIGDGETQLADILDEEGNVVKKGLSPLYNIYQDEGEGSLVQLAEEEAYGFDIDGVSYYPRSIATGYTSVALGRYNKVTGNHSMAANYNNTVQGKNSFAANSGNIIEEGVEASFVAGHQNRSTRHYQAVFGLYNEPTDGLLIVGNGGSTERSNAFKVDKLGNAFIGNTMYSNNAIIASDITIGSTQLNEDYFKNLKPEKSYKENFSENTIEQVIDTIRSGIIPETWNIGNELKVEIAGKERTIVIIGKEVDTFIDGTTAPFTFGFKELYEDWKAPMYDTEKDSSWNLSDMRTITLYNVLKSFPDILKNSIEPVIKYTKEGTVVTQTEDDLFLLSFPEMQSGTNDDIEESGAIYSQIYGSSSKRIKYLDGIAKAYVLRNGIGADNFRSITATGSRGGGVSTISNYFSPAFCITNKPALRIGNTLINEEQLKKLLNTLS